MAYCNYIRTVEYSSAEEMQSESRGVGQYNEIYLVPNVILATFEIVDFPISKIQKNANKIFTSYYFL